MTTAPVNPEGQTARDLTAEEIEAIHAWATVFHAKGCPKDASLLRRAVDQLERYAAQPSEGQTAQEVRDALTWLVEVIEKAGLLNLSNGVQLGPTVWFVKASDALAYAKRVLAPPEPKAETPAETAGQKEGP